VVAKVHDFADAIGGNISEHGLKREPISVHRQWQRTSLK
jgi:hypothetical protein